MTCWTQVVGSLTDREETKALAALKRLDAGRLNKVMSLFTQFIRSVERKSVSSFSMYPILPELLANLGSLGVDKHAENFAKAVRGRLSQRI
jgi:hypothetical protein